MRQTLKIGFVVLVVAALATSGLALAQSGEEEGTVTETPDRSGFIVEQLAPLVEDGTLTEAQAEAVAEVLAQNPRMGHRRPHGPGLETIGEFLGVTAEDLRTALEEGSTLGEIASANGSSAEALTEFLVDEAETRLDEAVEEGRIDETEKDEKLAEIEERIGAMVDGEAEFPGPRAGRRGGPRPGGPGFGGPGGPGFEAPQDGVGTDA
jgi:hypothetical protein